MKVYILKEQTTGICSAYRIIEVFTSLDDIKFWIKLHPEYLMQVASDDVPKELYTEDMYEYIDGLDTLTDINDILKPATFIEEWDTYERGDNE